MAFPPLESWSKETSFVILSGRYEQHAREIKQGKNVGQQHQEALLLIFSNWGGGEKKERLCGSRVTWSGVKWRKTSSGLRTSASPTQFLEMTFKEHNTL